MRTYRRSMCCGSVALAHGFLGATPALGDDASGGTVSIGRSERHVPVSDATSELRLQLLGALSLGRGLRFNNPFRLATPLGDTAESVSLAASYAELSFGVVAATAGTLRHGGSLGVLAALDGISQSVLTPSYLLSIPLSADVDVRGRFALPLVMTPDTTVGVEVATGVSWIAAGRWGVTAELIGTAFFGAGTEQSSVTTVPMLSGQLGLLYRHEVSL